MRTTATKNEIDLFENELQVSQNTPPSYITHAAHDNPADVDDHIKNFERLRKYSFPVKIHIYLKDGHGFIFKFTGWIDSLFGWIIVQS